MSINIKRFIYYTVVLCFLSDVLRVEPLRAQKASVTDIKNILKSPEIEGLYLRTYYSLLDRVDVDGFMQESLTDRYPGMFPRTVGGAVALFLETGEHQIAEKIIRCTLEAMTVNEMERIPHVFLRQKNNLIPVFNADDPMQACIDDIVCRFKNGSSAAIAFSAQEGSMEAIEAAIEVNACKGIFTMTVRKDKDLEPIRSARLNVKQVNPGQIWQRFEIVPFLPLEHGATYKIRFDFDGFGSPIWYGLKEIQKETTEVFWLEGAAHPLAWINKKNQIPAYAIDIGNLRHEQQTDPYRIYCDWDQIDGQAHVLMAWAWLALKTGRTDFEDQTYPLVAKLMDRTSDQPYFMWGRGHEVSVNLVQNIALEHSREGRYWHVWDLLTQCVVGSALKSMIEIAKRHDDVKHAVRWQDRLQVLIKGIDRNMTRLVNNKKVYLEMRLPNSAGGVPFTGMSWINFAPIMAQWDPLERQILRNTVSAMRAKLLLDFDGHKYLAMEYDPNGRVNDRWIIGKGVGWEIEYARQEKEYNRIKEWLEFLKAYHYGELYTESFYLDEQGSWQTGDGGNGEQSSWWCWAMARLRKEVGLPVVGVNDE